MLKRRLQLLHYSATMVVFIIVVTLLLFLRNFLEELETISSGFCSLNSNHFFFLTLILFSASNSNAYSTEKGEASDMNSTNFCQVYIKLSMYL